jgi:hypothetical protein
MNRVFLSLLLSLGLTGAALAWEQKPNKPIAACAEQLPYGVPASNRPNTMLRCNTAYALLHDNTAKIPIWVAYTLTPSHAIGCVARTNAFVADAAIPKATVTAKGMIVAANASSSPLGLAVGTNNQILVADSTTATGLKWAGTPEVLIIALGDETTAITTGVKFTFRMPFAMTLNSGNLGAKASLTTSSSSGLPTFRVNQTGSNIFSTNLSINASANTSIGATTAVVIGTLSLTDDALITIEVVTAGTNAAGAKIYLMGRRT